MTFLLKSHPSFKRWGCLLLLNSQSDAGSNLGPWQVATFYSALPLLRMSTQMTAYGISVRKETAIWNKWCCAPWKILRVSYWWLWLFFLLLVQKGNRWKNGSLFYFICLFLHYTMNLHKQDMFLVTDQLEKIHMLNQMGGINSFIKATWKSPVLQYHKDSQLWF
jgi:hypothetical protein